MFVRSFGYFLNTVHLNLLYTKTDMLGLMKNVEKKDGFKFAVTALTAIGTLSYLIYNYFQNTAVDFNLYLLGLSMVTLGIMSSFLLVVYVLIKGFSMEVQDSNQRNKYELIASAMYRSTFWLTLMLFIYIYIFRNPINSWTVHFYKRCHINNRFFSWLFSISAFQYNWTFSTIYINWEETKIFQTNDFYNGSRFDY